MPDFPVPAAASGAKKTAATGNYNLGDHFTGANVIKTLTSAALADSYGSWSQIDGTYSVDAFLVGAAAMQDGNSDPDYTLLGLGIGAPASEVSIAETIVIYVDGVAVVGGSNMAVFPYPIPIPATTRTAGRVQDDSGSARTHVVSVMFIDQADVVDF